MKEEIVKIEKDWKRYVKKIKQKRKNYGTRKEAEKGKGKNRHLDIYIFLWNQPKNKKKQKKRKHPLNNITAILIQFIKLFFWIYVQFINLFFFSSSSSLANFAFIGTNCNHSLNLKHLIFSFNFFPRFLYLRCTIFQSL